MKSISIFLLYGFIVLLTSEQGYSQTYFQQQVDYKIDAQLDTSLKLLKVVCDIDYTNNSTVELDTMIFHLWWNALGDKQSAYAGQQLNMGVRDFHFAPENKMGSYDELIIKDESGQTIAPIGSIA